MTAHKKLCPKFHHLIGTQTVHGVQYDYYLQVVRLTVPGDIMMVVFVGNGLIDARPLDYIMQEGALHDPCFRIYKIGLLLADFAGVVPAPIKDKLQMVDKQFKSFDRLTGQILQC